LRSTKQSREKEEWKQIYRQFPADFFDLIVIDECHRGSAADDSAWREVLDYFGGATHVGLTATPKKTKEVSNISYFGDPIYTYSLKQGIEDGFLEPYNVIRIAADVDAVGYTPEIGKVDKLGQAVEQRQYNIRISIGIWYWKTAPGWWLERSGNTSCLLTRWLRPSSFATTRTTQNGYDRSW
jgi:type I site-specific restriction endonuclease